MQAETREALGVRSPALVTTQAITQTHNAETQVTEAEKMHPRAPFPQSAKLGGG